MTKYSLSVLIPVYNSMNILPKLFERLCPILESHTVQAEVIFINDCSDDGSWEVICRLAEKHDWVRGINLMRNYGQHNALLRGIRAARHELIITMDDDLQNLPEEIPKLLAKLSEKYDVVYGSPGKRHHGFWRNLAARVTKLALQNIMGASTARESSTFRLFRTSLRKSFANYNNPFVSIDVLLTWGTSRFASVPVRDGPRMAGESNYSFGKLIVHALNMVTGFSVLPLQLASILGLFFTIFGIGVLSLVLGRYFITGTTVPGFAFLASTIAIFSGVQLFALGIIGEYLARMHSNTMGRPCSVARETIGFDAELDEK